MNSNKVMPFWEVLLDGLPLDLGENGALESILTEEQEQKATFVEIAFTDPDFRWLHDLLDFEGKSLELSLGWHENTMESVFVGYVSQIRAEFPNRQPPSITLIGSDLSQQLNDMKPLAWQDATDSEVVEFLLSFYPQLEIEVHPTSIVHEQISKGAGVKDIDFILELVRRNPGFTFYVRGHKAYFGPMRLEEASRRQLNYRAAPYNLIQFTPLFDGVQMSEEVSASDIDPETGEVINASAEYRKISVEGRSEWELVFDASESDPAHSVEDLQAQVDAEQHRRGFVITGTGESFPDPLFAPKQACVLSGLGHALSGTWYTSMVRNTISKNGWRQVFEVSKDAPGLSDYDSFDEEGNPITSSGKEYVLNKEDYRWYLED